MLCILLSLTCLRSCGNKSVIMRNLFLLLLLTVTSSLAQVQDKDTGVSDLGAQVPADILAGIVLTLKTASDSGMNMSEPQDLISAQEALQWISDRQYVIEPTVEWPSPELVEQRVWSDCKGKSLWLSSRLLRLGYRDVKLLIGKIPNSGSGHAWVELKFGGVTYIMDGTYRGRYTIIPKDRMTVHRDHKILYTVMPTGVTNGYAE